MRSGPPSSCGAALADDHLAQRAERAADHPAGLADRLEQRPGTGCCADTRRPARLTPIRPTWRCVPKRSVIVLDRRRDRERRASRRRGRPTAPAAGPSLSRTIAWRSSKLSIGVPSIAAIRSPGLQPGRGGRAVRPGPRRPPAGVNGRPTAANRIASTTIAKMKLAIGPGDDDRHALPDASWPGSCRDRAACSGVDRGARGVGVAQHLHVAAERHGAELPARAVRGRSSRTARARSRSRTSRPARRCGAPPSSGRTRARTRRPTGRAGTGSDTGRRSRAWSSQILHEIGAPAVAGRISAASRRASAS